MLSHARTRTSSSSSPLSFARSACLPLFLSLSLSRFLFLPLYRFLFRIELLLDLDTPAALGLGCCWTWAHRRLFGHGGTIAEWLVGPLLPCISPLHNDKASKIRAGLPPTAHKSAQCSLFSFFFESDKTYYSSNVYGPIPPLRCCCSGSMCVACRRELGERR